MHAWIRRLIAILEIGGGFMGFVLMLLSRQWNINKPVYDWILFIFFIFVFLFGIVSGLALLEKPQLGSALSAAYQALQIPVISSPLLTYELFSGLQLGFGWSKGRYVFLYGFGARSILVFWKRTAPWLIGVNTLALFFFIYLLIQFLPNIKSTSASGETINHANNVQPIEKSI